MFQKHKFFFEITQKQILELTSEIVASYLSNTNLDVEKVPKLIKEIHSTLTLIANTNMLNSSIVYPAIPIERSVTKDYILCLEDGKKVKMLKRHLKTSYGLTPTQYKRKWKLPENYPMVAPKHTITRSNFALKSGLGKNNKNKT